MQILNHRTFFFRLKTKVLWHIPDVSVISVVALKHICIPHHRLLFFAPNQERWSATHVLIVAKPNFLPNHRGLGRLPARSKPGGFLFLMKRRAFCLLKPTRLVGSAPNGPESFVCLASRRFIGVEGCHDARFTKKIVWKY